MLSAAIVVYKTPAELAAAVASLRAQTRPPDEIVVIDNGATEGCRTSELDEAEGVHIECPDANIGFGAGCNLALALTSGDELLFMNADVVLSATAVARLSERLRGDEQIAVVGPRIFSSGGVEHSARAFPRVRTGVLGRRSLLTRMLAQARRYPAELQPAHGGGGTVDWVSGACMAVRRSAFEAAGGFDEGYWMYWEDADLCRRLAGAGWTVYYEPSAVVHHAGGASGTSERTIRAFHESAARFARRHIAGGRVSRSLFRQALRARGWLVLRALARARRVS